VSNDPKTRILIVDDDPSIRTTVAMLLADEGYEVSTAEDGFDALLQMKSTVPELIVSDLNMPQMSGFEFLSVVRRRFPQLSVIAMSGAYHCGSAVPGGVIADAFYPKGQGTTVELLKVVAELIQTSDEAWPIRGNRPPCGYPETAKIPRECLMSP
jgi:CheY-like chemotaxis protein